MKGRIVHLNHNRGIYSVELPDGSYSVFELSDTNEIGKEDIIIGTLDELGSCILQNNTSEESFDAMIQNVGLNLQMAYKRTFFV